MAHNLMERNGMVSMFCVGDRDAAWHKLGQRTPNAVSWQEAMTLAGLDWAVVKQNLYDGNGKALAAFGIFRKDDNAIAREHLATASVYGQRPKYPLTLRLSQATRYKLTSCSPRPTTDRAVRQPS